MQAKFGDSANPLQNQANDLLLWAAKNKNIIGIRAALEAGANPNIREEHGLSPIMSACSAGPQMLEAVKLLIKAGADVNAYWEEYSWPTVLMLAVEGCSSVENSQHPDVGALIDALVEAGADIHARNRIGEPMLFKVRRNTMISNDEGWSPAVLIALAKHGADVESNDFRNFLSEELGDVSKAAGFIQEALQARKNFIARGGNIRPKRPPGDRFGGFDLDG